MRLAEFDPATFGPNRGFVTRAVWMVVSQVFFETWVPWPSGLKARILRAFGARIGRGVVIKPRVQISRPWRLTVGDDCWLGEWLWLDCPGEVHIGNNVCLSQGAMIESGGHDWRDPVFGVILEPVVLEDCSWVAARALVLPGSVLAEGSVLGGGAVLSGKTEPWGLYGGNPARRLKERVLSG